MRAAWKFVAMTSPSMQRTFPTPSSWVRLSQRASDEVESLSSPDYLRYEDALVELSVQLALGEAPFEGGGEHVFEYAGCTLLYRSGFEAESVLVDRVLLPQGANIGVRESASFALV